MQSSSNRLRSSISLSSYANVSNFGRPKVWSFLSRFFIPFSFLIILNNKNVPQPFRKWSNSAVPRVFQSKFVALPTISRAVIVSSLLRPRGLLSPSRGLADARGTNGHVTLWRNFQSITTKETVSCNIAFLGSLVSKKKFISISTPFSTAPCCTSIRPIVVY